MGENDQEKTSKKTGTSADTPEKAPEKTGTGAEKPSVSTSEETAAELSQLRKKIEEEKKEKETRREFLKKEAGSRRTPEKWVNNTPDEGIGSSIAKGIIESGVEEKFDKYIPQFQENGLGDITNVNLIKQAAKEIIYDFYVKNGNDRTKVTNYIKDVLGNKLKYIFGQLQEIFKNEKFRFKQPIECLETFSSFTGLNIINSGYVQLKELKTALLLEKSDYEFFLKSYEQYLNIGIDLHRISGEEANLQSKKAKEMDIAAMFKEGRIILKNKTRVAAANTPAETEAILRKAIYEQLPDNLDPKMRETAINHLLSESKKLDPQPGQTVEIAENGSFRIVDIKVEEDAKKQAKAAAEAQLATTESSEPISSKIGGSLGKFIESLMKFIQHIMTAMAPALAKLGISSPETAAGLTDEEKNEITEIKKVAEKNGLTLETLDPLFKDATQLRTVLKQKKDKNLAWTDYFKKYLTTKETSELKKKQNLKAEKIAEMFLSEAPQPPATPIA